MPVSAVDPRAFTPDELRDGWRLACRAPARGELVIEVPPLQTRPKAALVGVGRHVILRPSVQKRHLVLDEPTMEDQRSDFERLQDALEDLEPRAELPVLRTLGPRAAQGELGRHRGRLRRRADRRRAGRHDRAPLRDRVRPRHHDGGRDAARPRDRHAGRGAVDAQPPAAVRRRRDHAHLGDDDGRGRARRAAGARAGDDGAAHRGGVRRGARRPRRGLRDHRLRQRDDDAARAGHRPRAALDGAVRGHHARAAAARGGRLRRARPPARAGVRVPVARRLRRRRHRRGHARHRAHARQAAAAVHRRRHELGDRARQPGPRRRDRRAGRARRSRRRRSAAACAPPTARSRA